MYGRSQKLFAVEAIPHTFTIDADGVLQDEHIGDAAIEGQAQEACCPITEATDSGKARPIRTTLR